MPKIQITEKDYTGNVISTEVNNTVYFPFEATNDTKKDPMLCVTEDDLKKYLDTASKGDTKIPYRVAKYLINKGFNVLAHLVVLSEGKVPSTTWSALQDRTLYDIRFLTTGCLNYSDPNAVTCASKRGDCVALCDYKTNYSEQYFLTTSEPEEWATEFVNYYTRSDAQYTLVAAGTEFEPNKYFLKNGIDYILLENKPDDWATSTDQKYYKREYTYTQLTGTTAPTWEKDKYYAQMTSITSDTYNVKKIRDYYNAELVTKVTNDDLKYAAAFVPSIKTKNSQLLDGLKDAQGKTVSEIELPASIGYLLSYIDAFSKGNPEWYAVAGSFRGSIPELSDVLYEFSNAECEILQARSATSECALDATTDNKGFAINPIAYIKPFGYIIWGNRTLLINNGELKASSFLNVRHLVSSINKSLYRTSRKYTFEQNNDILWTNFQTEVAVTLDKMQSGNGILGYRFIKQATDKKARLKAKLRIIPIEAVEDFELGIELSDSLEIVE